VRVIAAGRASEIVDLGDGRVLRRFKRGGRPAREAAVMEHARTNGFPVPEVLDVLEDALVLERVEGPTMLAELRGRPWRASRHAQTLAELHARLHQRRRRANSRLVGRQPLGALPEDAVLQVRHAAGLAEPRLFQLDSLRELVEQPAVRDAISRRRTVAGV
jgi:Phosphotransferase enzyme family